MYVKHGELKFSKYDVTDYDVILDIVLDWTSKFKKVWLVHPFAGIPNLDDKDVPNLEKCKTVDDKWLSILNFIINSLEDYDYDYSGGYTMVNGTYEPIDQEAWDQYISDKIALHDRKKEAMRLFSKYIFEMWI